MVTEDRLLWKYIGVDESGRARTSFLDDLLFRVSPPHGFQDAFELRPIVIMEDHSNDDRRVARQKNVQLPVDEQIPDDLVDSFLLGVVPRARYDEKEFPGLWPAKFPELRPEPFKTVAELDAFQADRVRHHVETRLNESLAILCLTTAPDTPLFWEHYADGYRGVAIGLDPEILQQIPDAVLQPVDYSDQRVAITSNDGFIRVAGEPFEEGSPLPLGTVSRKSMSHTWEREVRLIIPLAAATSKPSSGSLYLFPLPPRAIRRIVVGYRVTTENLIEIIGQLRAHERWANMRLSRAVISDVEFALNLVPISWS